MKRLVLVPFLLSACVEGSPGQDSDPNTADDGVGGSAGAYEEIARTMQWASDMTVSVEDGVLTVRGDGIPNHAYDQTYAGLGNGGQVNEASVVEQDLRYELSLTGTLAASPTDTSGGPIGPAVSGAVFFNPYDAAGEYALEVTVQSQYNFIDDCGGHPSPNNGPYHYHGVPVCSSEAIDEPGEHSGAVGFLFDGFPIYGPWGEDGEEPSDLDECMGHVGHVPETDEAVYHYHTSYDRPYISACYSGTPQVSGGMGP